MDRQNIRALVFERNPDIYALWIGSLINRFGERAEEQVLLEYSPSKFSEIVKRLPNLTVVVVSFNTMTDLYSLPMLAEDLEEEKIKPDVILVGDFPSSWVTGFRDRYQSHRVFDIWACDLAKKMADYLTIERANVPVQ